MSQQSRNSRIAVVAVAVLIGALAAWIWADTIAAGQQEQRDDLDLFLDASSAGWAEVTSQFFAAPEVAAQTIGGLAGQMQDADERTLLLAEIIRQQPHLDAAYIGFPDGSFSFVGRDGEGGAAFRTRTISFDGDGQRRVNLTWRSQSLQVVRAEEDANDTYDPRLRPWYTPIENGADRHWTAPYVFSSSQLPGITHSVALRSGDSLTSVVGIDIRLSRVNEFLEALSPGQNGSALVVDTAGRIIAESSMDVADIEAVGDDEVLSLAQSSELQALVNEFATGGAVTLRGRSSDGLHTTIVRSAGARNEWYLAVQAADDDFLSDDAASNAFETFAVGVTVAASLAALGMAMLHYLARLKKDAEIDELTGVYNRRALRRQLEGVLASAKETVHVAIVDLDDFKGVNDEYGHQVGDAVLVELAQRMKVFGEDEGFTVGRLGGDEFVIFGDGTPDWTDLNRRLSRPVLAEGHNLSVTASVGATQSASTEHHPIEDLLARADDLLFDAKRQGGDRYATREFS